MNNFVTGLVTAESYANNKGLCGGPLKRCKAPDAYDHTFYLNGFAVGCSVSTAVVFALTLFYLPIDPLLKKIVSSKMKKRNQEVVQQSQWRPISMNRVEDTKISKLEKLVTRISFTELVNATDNFREDNIIELGKTGTMYKAVFSNGSFFAIKRLFDSQFSKGHFILQDVVDDSLIGLGFNGEIFEFMNIACKCIQSVLEQKPTMLEVYQTMRATGEKHGLVDDSEMWKETKIATASASEGDVEIIG
ncbi:unnamed protein product [Camellia sinensis]